MHSHHCLAPHNPAEKVEVAVDTSCANEWATGFIAVESCAMMVVTGAHTEERKILVLLYKYCPHYKYV